jgi:hypothetical protein
MWKAREGIWERREDEREEREGEALEEISGGRKAEVFVDRGKQSSSGDKYRTALVVVVNYQQGRMLWGDSVRVMLVPSPGLSSSLSALDRIRAFTRLIWPDWVKNPQHVTLDGT